MRLTGATKMWLLTSLAFFYIIIQYHFTNTWSFPTAGNADIQGEEAYSKTSAKTLWLKSFFGDIETAENVQNLIGNDIAKDLAYKFDHRLRSLCSSQNDTELPIIYIITPTYRRSEQIAELTRMAQTLMHLQNIYWLVIEDATEKSQAVYELLKKTGISSIQLTADPINVKYKGSKPKGVSSRIRGLRWIRDNVEDGVLYFGDDDNSYDIDLFDEMRYTKKVSMWPVGLVTQTGVSSPIVKNGTFSGFYDGWIGGRKFAVDMAGFAVNIKFLKQRPNATMAYKLGYEEDSFLKSLAPFEPHEIELKADNCTKVLVWHTQTKKNQPSRSLDKKKYSDTNLIKLKQSIV